MGCFWGSCKNRCNWNHNCCGNWNHDGCDDNRDDCEEERRRAYWKGYWDGCRRCGGNWENNNDDCDC